MNGSFSHSRPGRAGRPKRSSAFFYAYDNKSTLFCQFKSAEGCLQNQSAILHIKRSGSMTSAAFPGRSAMRAFCPAPGI